MNPADLRFFPKIVLLQIARDLDLLDDLRENLGRTPNRAELIEAITEQIGDYPNVGWIALGQYASGGRDGRAGDRR